MTAPSPLPSTIFVDGELVNESKLYARIWTVINYLLGLVNSTTGLGRLFVASSSGATYGTGANINFPTVVEDTAGGYVSGVYTCQSAGTWGFAAQLKAGLTAGTPQPILFKNGVAYCESFTPPSAAGSGSNIAGYVRLAVGDTVSCRTSASFVANSAGGTAANNYMQLYQMTFT